MMKVPEILRKTLSVAKALTTGKDVDAQRLEKRLEICSSCDRVQNTEDGLMKCGICGCAIRGDRSLVNLARYEETGDYGCKHPLGSRWKEQGV